MKKDKKNISEYTQRYTDELIGYYDGTCVVVLLCNLGT